MNTLMRSAVRGRSRLASPRYRWHRLGGIALAGMLAGLSIGKLAYAADEGLSHWDKSFLVSAIESDAAEIKASRIALEKSSSTDVKSFAQKMIDAHTKTGEELKQLAAQKNVQAPTEPSLAQRTKIDLLSKLSGSSFDKHYVDSIGVSAHEDAVKLFQSADKKSKDSDVKQFADGALPTLREHLTMASDLKSKVEKEK
ncbi:MAG TPA: DUF4142 domain-containing protein [Burkholderiaceae bacterium]